MDKLKNKVYKIRGQTTREKLGDTPLQYTVDRIVRHVGEGDKVRSVVRCCGYISGDPTVEPPEHIRENFVAR